jgi:hypothetical protein
MYNTVHVINNLILMKLEVCRQIFEKKNFVKICRYGADLFHGMDRQTDMTKQIVAFRNSSKARKDENGCYRLLCQPRVCLDSSESSVCTLAGHGEMQFYQKLHK